MPPDDTKAEAQPLRSLGAQGYNAARVLLFLPASIGERYLMAEKPRDPLKKQAPQAKLTPAGGFGKAVSLHEAGQLDEALALYQEILQAQPNHFNCLHLAGVISLQKGNPSQALKLIEQAIAANPSIPSFHSNRGNALLRLQRPEEALTSYNRAISLQPDLVEAYHNRGNAFLDLKRPDDALASLNHALSLDPSYAKAHCSRGSVLSDLGRLDEGLSSFDLALTLNPDYAKAWSGRGQILLNQHQATQAIASFDKAIALQPDMAQTHFWRGNALMSLKRHEDARISYSRVLDLDPEHANAWNNRGNALMELKRPEEALSDFDKALALRPDLIDSWSNRGVALHNLRRATEAVESYDHAITLQPNSVDAYYNRAIALKTCQRLDESLVSYDHAIRLRPNFAGAHWNKSLILLLKGDFPQGWSLYEWRWLGTKPGFKPRNFSVPQWLGIGPLQNKTLLLHPEQGLGDTIQFCRYAPLLKAQGARVIIEVPPGLRSILSSLAGVDEWITVGDTLPAFDMHCPMMSLPLACKTFSEADIPANHPYLFADPQRVTHWSKKLGEKTRPRVGLVWSGGFRPNQPEIWEVNGRRNIPFALIARLNRPDMDFYSLQKGEPAESELPRIKDKHWPTDNLHVLTDDIEDFADTAALIANLDLIIGVDTSTLHLAAALGKPVWLLNRWDTCWRWMLERQDSPWYPTLKIYRQPQPDAWEAVISQVGADLGDIEHLHHVLTLTTTKATPTTSPATPATPTATPSGESSEIVFRHALSAHQGGRLDEARALYESVLQQSPNHGEALHMLGIITAQQGDQKAGLVWINRAIEAGLNNGFVYYNRGKTLQELRRFDQALSTYDESVKLMPNFAEAHSNRGNILIELKRPEEALASFDRALTLKPDYAEAHYNRGVVLRYLMRLDEAILSFDRSIELRPELPIAYTNKGAILLLQEKFTEGWPLYAKRLQTPPIREFPMPAWSGSESLQDKTIVLHEEQGFSNIIHLSRYIAHVKALGARQVILEVTQPLLRLFRQLHGVDVLVEKGSPLTGTDFHAHLLSLPEIFKTFALTDIPAPIPYLHPDKTLVAEWANRIGTRRRWRVGLVWSGGLRAHVETLGENSRRNVPFALLAQINHPDIDFYSLQKGDPAESELAQIKDQFWPTENLHVFADHIRDFADTAALIANLDLVVSVDTATAHLAGALGKPVWLLNRFDTDWRWFIDRQNSPWYPSMRIFRQPRPGQWEAVIAHIQADIQTLSTSSPPPTLMAPAPGNS